MSKDEVGEEGQYQKVANKNDLQDGSMIKVQPNENSFGDNISPKYSRLKSDFLTL
jgi:hypothetical protein